MNRAHTLLPRGLIVSCVPGEGTSMHPPESTLAFAVAAEAGGAVAVVVCGVEHVRAVKRVLTIPIIGWISGTHADGSLLITPTVDDAKELVRAGADLVHLDATSRIRPGGMSGPEMVEAVLAGVNVPVLAAVGTVEEGIEAIRAGAELVSTTLSGEASPGAEARKDLPDVELIERLAERFPLQIIAEGRFWTPEQAALALKIGAYGVIVGEAITSPVQIVKRFASGLRRTGD